MIFKKGNIHRRGQVSLLLLICMSTVLSGCSKPQPEPQGTTPSVESTSPTGTNKESNTNNTTKQPNPPSGSTVSDTEGIPSGVTIKKVIKDVEVKNNYRKKVELLSDGGKRITITDPNGGVVMKHIEYEGVILSVNGKKVDVQVEHGGKQTLTIPNEIVIEDDENLGLVKGVEIEWDVDTEGKIQSVELED
ncbi:hypothetical protein PMSM_03710 [Paenibacillus macquariensis subsp. macquariensis]|uniref:Lipoprotein n=2 Tax=Paenibacillus macquariensis TaxID=948756 RepID=A0ABY1JMX4_9BACL|nr:hypothetical protein PMSM_03710 [Paenibacillus macquariensis subsp. macquariensis]SIQ47614.1 hypothetical protein SAMN05421578_102163 [Paenibacillus macquariensis]